MGKKISTPKDQFDPSELETTELVYKNATEHSDYTPDTSADPEGSEARQHTGKQFPERVHRDYLVKDGLVNVSSGTVEAVMAIFDQKKDSDCVLTDNQQEVYTKEVQAIVDGKKPLLNVDAPTSGFNMLSEMTRTWAEFACAIYDYTSWARQLNPEMDQPESFTDLENKMHELGRKARMLRDASSELWIFFNINGTFKLDGFRVQKAIEGRYERLASYYNNKFTESTVGTDMKKANIAFTEDIVKAV
jgi:hypothetical protein